MGQGTEVCSRPHSWLHVICEERERERKKRFHELQTIISSFQEVIINNWKESCFQLCFMCFLVGSDQCSL